MAAYRTSSSANPSFSYHESDPRCNPNATRGDYTGPMYADVITELKKKSFATGKDSMINVPFHMAPMQSCLQQPQQNTGLIRSPRPKEQATATPLKLRDKAQKSLDESQKRLKAIEDHMWQHRQEERNLRRAENDIIRQQKHMQTSLKQFENKIVKRQAEETNTLLDKEAKFAGYWQKDLHDKNEATKEKIQTKQETRQKLNEARNKYTKNSNELSWRYRSLMDSLSQKKTEMEDLSKQFEALLREKEEEQLHMKQQLASLAISLNMEAQKKRKLESDTQQQTAQSALKSIADTQTKEKALLTEEKAKIKAETNFVEQQRGLEQSLDEKNKGFKSHQRSEGHNLANVRTHLKETMENQHYMQQEMDHLQLSILSDNIRGRVDAANTRRDKRLNNFQRRVKEKNMTKLQDWATRTITKDNEEKLKERQEKLTHLSKIVSHHDTVEHSLFSQAREADSQIKRQGQTLSKLQEELETLKKTNARKIKEMTVTAARAEMELHHKILRESAEFSKAINVREETIRTFTKYKNRNKEDRRMLDDEKREHDRRVRIADRSQLESSTVKSN